ncbi:unnamed protein product [Rotaria sp. Silwood1]|nr:unnamed protein product [Rotaria sp. Silwood1]
MINIPEDAENSGLSRGSDKHELDLNSTQRNQPNEPDIFYFYFDYLRRRDLDYDDYDDDVLGSYYENRYRSALDRIDLRDILVGHGIDITCFAKENSDLVLHDRLERCGLNDAWSED